MLYQLLLKCVPIHQVDDQVKNVHRPPPIKKNIYLTSCLIDATNFSSNMGCLRYLAC